MSPLDQWLDRSAVAIATRDRPAAHAPTHESTARAVEAAPSEPDRMSRGALMRRAAEPMSRRVPAAPNPAPFLAQALDREVPRSTALKIIAATVALAGGASLVRPGRAEADSPCVAKCDREYGAAMARSERHVDEIVEPYDSDTAVGLLFNNPWIVAIWRGVGYVDTYSRYHKDFSDCLYVCSFEDKFTPPPPLCGQAGGARAAANNICLEPPPPPPNFSSPPPSSSGPNCGCVGGDTCCTYADAHGNPASICCIYADCRCVPR